MRRRTAFLATLGLAAGLAASPASAQDLIPLRVATTPIDAGAQVYYAADMGFFKKAGFDVQITSLPGGPAIAAGIISGAFDFAQINIPTLAVAHEKGIPFTLVAPASVYTMATAIQSGMIVRKDSTIASAKDISGKVAAVNALGTIQQISVEAWVDQNGGDSTTIKFVELPGTATLPAVVASRIDTALIYEPEFDGALKDPTLRVLGDPFRSLGSGKDFLISAWMCGTPYAKAHPDLVKRFAAVMAETARWANTHRTESAAILEKYTKVAMSPTASRALYAETFNLPQIQPLLDISAKYGLLKKTFPAADLLP